MTRLSDLDVNHLDAERRALVEQVMGGRGRLPTPFRVWIASPELARLLHPLGRFFASATSLDKAEAEIAILAAARQWSAEYVLAVHASEARDAGLADDVIAALIAGEPALPVGHRQRAVVDMMAALAANGAPAQETFDAAVAALGHAGVAEVLALAGYFSAVALAMKFFDVKPPMNGIPPTP